MHTGIDKIFINASDNIIINAHYQKKAKETTKVEQCRNQPTT